MTDDQDTGRLRVEQVRRELAERERAHAAPDEAEAHEHERRAEKAAYLRSKLEARERSEREPRQEE